MPPSYTRLIGCDRYAHITLLHCYMQSDVCLLATHVQALGGHPLQWGAATSGSSATLVQAVGSHPLQWGAATSGSSATHVQAVGGHPLQWGAATSGSSTPPPPSLVSPPPLDYFLQSKKPGWASYSEVKSLGPKRNSLQSLGSQVKRNAKRTRLHAISHFEFAIPLSLL